MAITREDMLKIAEQLDGTAGTLETILEDEYGLEFHEVPLELLNLLDEHVMQCSLCGWWSDSSGFDDDQVCAECQENNAS